MASPDLVQYEYKYQKTDIVGTIILADSTTQTVAVDNSTSQVVLGPFDTTGLVNGTYGYKSDYPLMLKLFCDTIDADATGEYKLTVSGSLGSTSVKRTNLDSFGMTWNINDWDSLTDADATVSLQAFSPMTSISMNCTCGIATDYIDRNSEGSYA